MQKIHDPVLLLYYLTSSAAQIAITIFVSWTIAKGPVLPTHEVQIILPPLSSIYEPTVPPLSPTCPPTCDL